MILILFLLLLAAVGIGCLLPAHRLPPLPNDKLLHFGAFAVLSLLGAQLLPAESARLFGYGGLLLFGLLLEILQNQIPGRSFCWRDMAANAAGIATAAALVWLMGCFF